MQMTFQEMYEEAQEQAQDNSATSLVIIKRGINMGLAKFQDVLGREWTRARKTFSTVANQQYYQLPEDCIRVKAVTLLVDDITYSLTEIESQHEWDRLNETTVSSDIPTHFYIRGHDELGLYPIPSTAGTNSGTLTYEPEQRDLTVADYSTGTIAVTNDSTAVVGTGTTFTSAMVGRKLRIDNPSGDGNWYRIAGYTDATHITLENKYSGATASTQTYKIGEVPNIPSAFHEALIDYAMYRYYKRRRDISTANEMKGAFVDALETCRTRYSSKTSSQYIAPKDLDNGYTYVNRDYRVTNG